MELKDSLILNLDLETFFSSLWSLKNHSPINLVLVSSKINPHLTPLMTRYFSAEVTFFLLTGVADVAF